jgi:hypothetical protein
MAIKDETNFKTIYDVVKCAGITNTDMSDVENVIDVYQKIAYWVNDELSDMFTASITTVTASTRYRLELTTVTGTTLCYGYANNTSSGGNHQSCWINYASGVRSGLETISITNLRMMVVHSKYGFIAGFTGATTNNKYSVRLMGSTGIDSSGLEKAITTVLDGTALYISLDASGYIKCESYGENNSYSDKTGFFPFMPPKTALVCEHVRECNGNVPEGQVFFEVDGKTYCAITAGSGYKGLALEIEEE